MIIREPWYVDPVVYSTLEHSRKKTSSYTLEEGGGEDYQKVNDLYQRSPVPGYFVGKVQIVDNRPLA